MSARLAYASIVYFVLATALDYGLTYVGVSLSGIGAEGNPYMRVSMEHFGVAKTLFNASAMHLWPIMMTMIAGDSRRIGAIACAAWGTGHMYAAGTWLR